jgi:hypothetical protein
LHERELGAAAKMFMQAAFGGGNGNCHAESFNISTCAARQMFIIFIMLPQSTLLRSIRF